MTNQLSWAALFGVLILALGLMIGAWVMFDRPKTAHWVDDPEDPGIWYECSACGEPLDWKSMYCPHCGRLMRED